MNKEKIYLPFIPFFAEGLVKNDDRPFNARDYIYASELGKGFFDRYLSMQGIEYSNPPNKEAMQKFFLGHMIEDMFKLSLFEFGLLIRYEEPINTDNKNMLNVHGRFDISFGGKISAVKIDDFLEKYSFMYCIQQLRSGFNRIFDEYKNIDFAECFIECKSCSDYTYNRCERENRPMIHDSLQAFHYAYHKKMPCQIIYYDKNNGRMQGFWVSPMDKELLRLYKEDIAQMSYYYQNKIAPQKESLFIFNETFTKNWEVEYSKYLKSEYGFNTKEEYRQFTTRLCARWNAILRRIKDGKPMTAENLKGIEEMRTYGFVIEGAPITEDAIAEIINDVPIKESTTKKLERLND